MKRIIEYIKNNFKLVVGVLIVGTLIGYIIGNSPAKQHERGLQHQHPDTLVQKEAGESKDQTYTCSMHPQVRSEEPGDCPICGMDLVPVSSMESEESGVDPDAISMTESAIKLADIQTTTVKKTLPEKKVYLDGKVKADERKIARLTARFGGRIEDLFINFTGEKVQKGEKLATIYSPELVSAQRELLEAVKYKDTRPEVYEAARNKLKLWDLSNHQITAIEQNKTPKKYFDMLSPLTGTVTMRHVALGNYVKKGEMLFEVTDLSELWVLFEAYETDLPWIKLGDEIQYTVKAIPGQTFKGKVSFIEPFINEQTRVAKVRVEQPNNQGNLKPEMFVKGTLISETATNNREILIPSSAVLWTGKRSIVYVKDKSAEAPVFHLRNITLGPKAGDKYVVEAGLEEGEQIVTNGVFKIDAAAQLDGKPSMMNPEGGERSTGHQHDGGSMDNASGKDMQLQESEGKASHEDMQHQKNGSGNNQMQGMDQNHQFQHESFNVLGNCSMCKSRIEKAANSLQGVETAEWNVETKMLHVSYQEEKVDLDKIHQTIAGAGHDTKKATAPDSVYEALPGCCKYTRRE